MTERRHPVTGAPLLDDYTQWHAAQVSSGDIDPVYPVLERVADAWDLDLEQRAWLVVLHVTWYQPGATLAAFAAAPTPRALPASFDGLESAGMLGWPTGVERRGHRSRAVLARYLLTLRDVFRDGVGPVYGYDPSAMPWDRLNARIAAVPGNGRWAAYKTAEMLQKVAGWPTQATDAGHRYSSGPRKGLAVLLPGVPAQGAQSPAAIARLDAMTDDLARRLGETDVAQVETSLCDFYSLYKGGYYLGHDIDSMLASFRHPALAPLIPPEAFDARAASFDPRFLGEVEGWDGVRTGLKRRYAETGQL